MLHLRSTFSKCSIFLVFFFIFALTACQSDTTKESDSPVSETSSNENAINKQSSNQHKAATLRTVEAIPVDQKIVKPAYLHNQLPDSAFAYVRIPNVWSFVGTAKGNVFDNAINAKPFFNAVESIRAGLSDNVIPEIPDEKGQLLATLVLKQLNSPLEAMAIEGVDAAIPTPNIVISSSADFKSNTEIQTLLDTLAKHLPELEITKAIDAEGYAELKIVNLNGQLQWDQASSRLTILLGLSLSPNNLVDLLKTLVSNNTHQMKDLENSIDSSGQGFFAWANPRKLSSIASTMGMQKELAPLAVMGVSSMKNIALGSGTSGGINRFKYVAEMPVTGFRSYLPIINTAPTFMVSGETKMIASFGLPSRASFSSIENTIALVTPPKDMKTYYKAKKSFKSALGFNVEDIFDFFGQDVSFVSDEAGGYVAIRLNDAEKFKSTLESSVKKLNLDYQQRAIGGHTYHHLKIPSFYDHYIKEEMKKKKSKKDQRLLVRMMSLPSHVYWEQEGDYLIMSNIPQTLIDRHYVETKITANDWLQKQQRIDPQGALMMLSARNDGTAEKMYRMHLGALNTLADFTGNPIDMFALATPREAKLPKKSSYGIKVTSSETQLAFEMNYESNPLEVLFAGSAYEGIAVVGILAAIAVPAYSDYETRSKLSLGVLAAEQIKLKLNVFEIEYGRYPNEFEIEDLKLNIKNAAYSITVSKNTGEINLTFNHNKLRSRNTLKMIPPKQGVSTTWSCQAKINKKYLPKSCRKKF